MPTPASIIQKLRNEGSLKFYADFRTGSGLDLSGTGNHLVIGGADVQQQIRGMRIPATGNPYTCVASTGCDLVAGGTVIWFGNQSYSPNGVAATKYLIGKGTGAAFDWTLQWVTAGGGSLRLVAAAASTLVVSQTVIEQKRYIAVNHTHGNKSEFYLDGIFAGLGNVITSVVTNNPVVAVHTTPAGAGTFAGLTQAALIISRRLTSTEHALLYYELSNLVFPTVQ
jgi:hypothetical protein